MPYLIYLGSIWLRRDSIDVLHFESASSWNIRGRNNFKRESEKIFQTRKIMKQHIRSTHGEAKIFTCNMCSRIFVTKNVLNNHIKNFHQKGSRNFKCDSCEKVFTSSESLKRHIKTLHEGQKNYKCDSCGKFFTQSGNLKTHIKTNHEGQRNYKCNQEILTSIWRHFMKDKKITNVILVENSSVAQVIFRNISRLSIILVANPSPHQYIWRYMPLLSMKDRKITSVILVENPLLK